MTRRRIAAAVLAAVLIVAGWFGYGRLHDEDRTPAAGPLVQAVPGVAASSGVETVDADGTMVVNGGTPMAERFAVLGLLNKRNGASRELTLKPGQAGRTGDVVVRLRACETTAPWEPDQLTGAFVQLDVRGADRHWRRTFSGWLFKERPALNVVQHPIYDVWVKSCAMSFPDKGPDTVSMSDAPARSKAKKSPDAEAGADETPTTSDSASDNSTM